MVASPALTPPLPEPGEDIPNLSDTRAPGSHRNAPPPGVSTLQEAWLQLPIWLPGWRKSQNPLLGCPHHTPQSGWAGSKLPVEQHWLAPVSSVLPGPLHLMFLLVLPS